MINKFFTATCFLCFFFTSCVPESETLTPPERQIVDTLYSYEVKDLRLLLDSTCTAQKDSLIKVAVDSIMKLRMEEMQKILNRE